MDGRAEFDVNDMKVWILPVLFQRFRLAILV